MIGTTITHYEILEELGRGGMGVVYKAMDTKLNRTVALKFLPPHVVAAEKDRVRFRREAQAAAGLSHPNIATVFAIEEADDQAFIAMEFVDGETLADRIDRGPLKIDDAIDIAIQIAEGLQVAHEQQIVHRDIKPSNIMLTSRGHIKIMDFGLAKISQASMLTQSGSTLGTVGYMSPEQARGEDVDRRTDIWGLGCVLYQMISGRTPFVGEYEQAIVYSILNANPEPLTGLRTGVPIALDGIMAKILAKDPGMRYQHVDELPADLKVVKAGSGAMMSRAMPAYSSASMAAAPQTAVAPSYPTREISAVEVRTGLPSWLPWSVAGIGVLAALVLFLLRPAAPEPEPVRMLALPMPEGGGFIDDSPSISQDGSTIAFEFGPGENQLYSYRFDEGTHIPLASVYESRGEIPFLSPTGRSIGWGTARNGYFRINRQGGNAESVTDPDLFTAWTWTSESDLLAIESAENFLSGRVFRMIDSRADTLLTLERSGLPFRIFHLDHIPDTQLGLISWIEQVPDRVGESVFKIGVFNLGSGEITELASNAIKASWLDNNYVVFTRGSNLLAMSFDPRSLEAGPAFQVYSGVNQWGTNNTRYDLSDNGVMVFSPGNAEVLNQRIMATVGRNASDLQPFDAFKLNVRDPRLSPDGTRLLVASLEEEIDVWLLDLERSTVQRMTYTSTEDETPAWAPDGRHFYWSGDDGDTEHLLRGDTNDPTRIDTLFVTPRHLHVESVSADDRFVFMSLGSETNGRDLFVHDRTTGETTELLATRFEDESAVLSPDGKWLAYRSDETGAGEVYLNSFPAMDQRRTLTSGGGAGPIWSKDGKTLYYFSREFNLTKVPVSNGIPGRAETYLDIPEGLASSASHRNWDIVGDDRLMVFLQSEGNTSRIEVAPLLIFTGMRTMVAHADPANLK